MVKYIAEIGINHNGSLDLAYQHIDKAYEAGASIVKFQTYRTSSRVSHDSPIFNILKSCELPFDSFHQLKSYSERLGLGFSSTPFCIESAEYLISIGIKYLKIASFHFENRTLINYILNNIQDGCHLMISTGLTSRDNIIELRDYISSLSRHTKKAFNYTFMHCVSQYPVLNPTDYNLSNISMISDLCNGSVAYSDHTIGTKAAQFAVIMGANAIEKHFTIDPSLPGADHSMSADPTVFRQLVDDCNLAYSMLGSHRLGSYACESDILPFKVSS